MEALNKLKKYSVLHQFFQILMNRRKWLFRDSLKDGMCCCLIQNNKPVAFASRALTDTKKNYAQIEKEFLAILFACIKCHWYVYGREIQVVSDHKPLLDIMQKVFLKFIQQDFKE